MNEGDNEPVEISDISMVEMTARAGLHEDTQKTPMILRLSNTLKDQIERKKTQIIEKTKFSFSENEKEELEKIIEGLSRESDL